MSTYRTRIAAVLSRKTALIIRFSHPADCRPPALTGYGIGEEWMKSAKLRYIETAMMEAACVSDLDALSGRMVTVNYDHRTGVMEGLVFEDDQNYRVVWFPDFCKP